ncbi:Glu/Leu/Phe/Val dehydrogenase [Rhodobacteraceae bacterium CCMM004]|nr:Glu/Leu/Phe/Val dehydrogenase [Rhodobacteraceae bacterium CCMM004]
MNSGPFFESLAPRGRGRADGPPAAEALRPSRSSTEERTDVLTDLPDYDTHEAVIFVNDRASGLSAIIAIHDTTLGPAHGGTRAWAYASDTAAAIDALRLSRGMTYKNAIAGLPLGGGKSVILLDPGQRPSAAALRAFGRAVDMLGGRYLPAEDVGVGPAEVREIAAETAHVLGVAEGADADPSPLTALGVLSGMREMLRRETGRADLAGRTVAVQGLGGVGGNLARMIHEAGGRLIVADMRAERCAAAEAAFGARVVPAEGIHSAPADVFAPCALGAVLNARTIPELGARIVCGGANNQLADEEAGRTLAAAGIAYAPDFIVNAGGVMWTSAPITGLDRPAVEERVRGIGATLGRVLDAMAPEETPQEAAIRDACAAIGRR